jgi:hypothetical protein
MAEPSASLPRALHSSGAVGAVVAAADDVMATFASPAPVGWLRHQLLTGPSFA